MADTEAQMGKTEESTTINGIPLKDVATLYIQTALIYIVVGVIVIYTGVVDGNTYKGMSITMAVAAAVAILAAVYGAKDKVAYMVKK